MCLSPSWPPPAHPCHTIKPRNYCTCTLVCLRLAAMASVRDFEISSDSSARAFKPNRTTATRATNLPEQKKFSGLMMMHEEARFSTARPRCYHYEIIGEL